MQDEARAPSDEWGGSVLEVEDSAALPGLPLWRDRRTRVVRTSSLKNDAKWLEFKIDDENIRKGSDGARSRVPGPRWTSLDEVERRCLPVDQSGSSTFASRPLTSRKGHPGRAGEQCFTHSQERR